jgi:hypothetical protein
LEDRADDCVFSSDIPRVSATVTGSRTTNDETGNTDSRLTLTDRAPTNMMRPHVRWVPLRGLGKRPSRLFGLSYLPFGERTVMDDPTGRMRSWSQSIRALTPALFAIALLPGCASWKSGTTATSFMKTAQGDKDPNKRYEAYHNLGSLSCYDRHEQKLQAVKLLSQRLDPRAEPTATRAVICWTLGEVGLPEGRPAIVRALDDPDPVVRQAAYHALGKVGIPSDATTLARRVTADADQDCKIAAIRGVAKLKPNDPRIEVALVEGMEDQSPALRLYSVEALREITGKDFGPDPEPWRKYTQARLEKVNGGDKGVLKTAAESPAPKKKWWSGYPTIPSLEQRGLARDKDKSIQVP